IPAQGVLDALEDAIEVGGNPVLGHPEGFVIARVPARRLKADDIARVDGQDGFERGVEESAMDGLRGRLQLVDLRGPLGHRGSNEGGLTEKQSREQCVATCSMRMFHGRLRPSAQSVSRRSWVPATQYHGRV